MKTQNDKSHGPWAEHFREFFKYFGILYQRVPFLLHLRYQALYRLKRGCTYVHYVCKVNTVCIWKKYMIHVVEDERVYCTAPYEPFLSPMDFAVEFSRSSSTRMVEFIAPSEDRAADSRVRN